MNNRWTIGEVAKLFEVSTDTLRYYEKAGILSVDKNSQNGYRNYTYDDIVILMDVLFFRNMDIAVKDIKQIIKMMDISDIRQLLTENQRIIDNKISNLIKKKQMLAQVTSQYRVCEERLGKFEIVSAPNFKYKFMGKHDEDLFDIILRYKKLDADWMNNIRYSILIPYNELITNMSFSSAQLGLSIDNDNLDRFDFTKEIGLLQMCGGNYLSSVVCTDYKKEANFMLNKAFRWLEEQGKEVIGPLVGRYMASSHKEQLDYYEIWIEVK